MIKMMKRLFFYAAFLLCAVLVFAADNSKKTDRPAIRVYDSKDKLVCELTESEDIEAFTNLLTESAAVAADDAAFTTVPKNAKIAYRYEIFEDPSTSIRLLIYADRKTAYIPNAPKTGDMPKVFAWEPLEKHIPDWAECTLSKEGYELFKNPVEVLELLNDEAGL